MIDSCVNEVICVKNRKAANLSKCMFNCLSMRYAKCRCIPFDIFFFAVLPRAHSVCLFEMTVE